MMKSHASYIAVVVSALACAALLPVNAEATPQPSPPAGVRALLASTSKASDEPGSVVLAGAATKALPSRAGSYRLAADSQKLKVWLSRRASDQGGVCVTVQSKESSLTVVNCVSSDRLESQDLDLKFGEGAVSTTVRVSAKGLSAGAAPLGFVAASRTVSVKSGASQRTSAVVSESPTRKATRIADTFYNGKIKQNTVINSPVRKKIIGAGTEVVQTDQTYAYIASGIYYAEAPRAVAISFSSRDASAACKWTYLVTSYKTAQPMKCVTYHY